MVHAKQTSFGPSLPLTTQRLLMRDFTLEDMSSILNIIQHPRFEGYRLFRPDHAAEDVKAFMVKTISFQKPQDGPREIYRLAVCLKNEPETVMGYCVFHGWNTIPESREDDQLGYFINPDYQGQGYAVEASNAILQAYFTNYPDRIVYAHAHPDNKSSQKVLEKLGFNREELISIDVKGNAEPRFVFRMKTPPSQ